MGVAVKTQDDTAKLVRRYKKAYPQTFRAAGAYIRAIAQKSIKKTTSQEPSPPGKPPKTRAKEGGLRKAIAYAAEKESVVIGPTQSGVGKIGHTHEFGGQEPPKTPPVARKYNWRLVIGGHGPIRIKGSSVIVGRLTSAAQVERAKELAPAAMETSEVQYLDSLMAHWTTGRSKVRKYPARPFMGPALQRSKERLPRLWANSVKGG